MEWECMLYYKFFCHRLKENSQGVVSLPEEKWCSNFSSVLIGRRTKIEDLSSLGKDEGGISF